MNANPNETWLQLPLVERRKLAGGLFEFVRPVVQKNFNPLLPARTFPARQPRLRWNGEKWCLLEALV